jgi:hypothetical protein
MREREYGWRFLRHLLVIARREATEVIRRGIRGAGGPHALREMCPGIAVPKNVTGVIPAQAGPVTGRMQAKVRLRPGEIACEAIRACDKAGAQDESVFRKTRN